MREILNMHIIRDPLNIENIKEKNQNMVRFNNEIPLQCITITFPLFSSFFGGTDCPSTHSEQPYLPVLQHQWRGRRWSHHSGGWRCQCHNCPGGCCQHKRLRTHYWQSFGYPLHNGAGQNGKWPHVKVIGWNTQLLSHANVNWASSLFFFFSIATPTKWDNSLPLTNSWTTQIGILLISYHATRVGKKLNWTIPRCTRNCSWEILPIM